MDSGASLSDYALFTPSSIHASRDYVDKKVSEETSGRSSSDDSLLAAIQGVDTKLTTHKLEQSHVTQDEKAAWNAKCPLENGKVPTSALPSFVDDVIEADTREQFPSAGESGKIYVAKDSNKTYRWGGSGYVEISQSLALGETESTAYPGNKGAQDRLAISAERERAVAAEATINEAIARFLKDASVSLDGKTLTITKKDGTTVQFQGGSSAWADITGKPQSFTPSSHQHTKEQITDFGGPYLPTSGGTVSGVIGVEGFGSSIPVYTDILNTEYCANGIVRDKIEGNVLTSGGYSLQFPHRSGIIATDDQIPYPLSYVTDGALKDRTVNTSTTGGTFILPAKVGTASRDFSLVISAQETAPSVSFPTTGVTYVSEQSASELWSAEANKINEWYFHENGANQFAVFHRAFSTVTQGS